MKKSNLIMTLVIVLIILGIGYYALKPAFVPIKPVQNVPCSNEYWEAINKTDVTICELATDIATGQKYYCRDNCIKEIAYKKGEPGLCKLIN